MNGQELKQKRLDLGLSQKALGKAIDRSRKTINTYENGATIPPDVQKLLKYYFENVTKGDTSSVTHKGEGVEDIIAKKVLSDLEPYFDKMIEAIAKMDIELTRLRILQEDTKEKVDTIEKRR